MLKNIFKKLLKKYGLKFIIRLAIDLLNDYLLELEKDEKFGSSSYENLQNNNNENHM